MQTSGDRSDRSHITGRFPANLIHDGSEEVVRGFPETKSGSGIKNPKGGAKSTFRASVQNDGYYTEGDSGSASRFFYCAKSSKSERNKGLEGFVNSHPTIKPISLMRYLCKLVTPPKGTVLDPFLGSGTTAIAAKLEGFDCIGIEMDKDYCEIASARIKAWHRQEKLFS